LHPSTLSLHVPQSVTGESAARSRSLLESSDWSVEAAVANYFAIQGASAGGSGGAGLAADPYGSAGSARPGTTMSSPPNSAILPSQPLSSARSGSTSASSFMSRPSAVASGQGTKPAGAGAASASAAAASASPPPSASASPPGSGTQRKSGGGYFGAGLFGALKGALFGAGGGGNGGAAAASSSGANVARTPQQQFLHDFAQQYGPHVPDFFPGTYTDAVKEAKSRGRMLFLYLHCTTHDDTEAFVRGTLCTESVCNFLRENFVSWAGSIKSADAYRLAQTLSVASFPYVAALSPQGAGSTVAVVFRHTGPLGAEELMSQLLLRMETHESILGSMAAQRSQADASRDSARELREQQDAEYAESLLMDQTLKESKAREAAEMEEILRQSREAEAAAEAQRVREAAEAEAARQAAEAARAQLAATLPPEPAAGEPGVVNVSLRLPTGAKTARRFRDSEPLRAVRAWVASLEEMSSLAAAGQQRFRLLSNFPRKVHEDPDQALADLKLGKQILFVVEAVEDEEDEAEQ